MRQLIGVELKLRRADTHLEDLDRSVTSFLDDINAKPLAVDIDPETGRHVYSVQYLPPIPTDWPLIVGEILHHLRSALDHLAWQLVLLDKGTPTKDTNFPIKDEPSYKKNGRLVPVNLNPPVRNREVIKALSKCQPYIGPDGEPLPVTLGMTPIGVTRHPLHELRELNNIDKHRILLVVAYGIDTFRPKYWDFPGRSLKPRFYLKPLEEGSPVASFDFGGADAPADFDSKISLEVAIDTPELPHLVNVPLTRTMHRIAMRVSLEVIDHYFRALFA